MDIVADKYCDAGAQGSNLCKGQVHENNATFNYVQPQVNQ
jgi:hypothetical protein